MAKPLPWERLDDATYAWPLGLHYYAEETEDGVWPPRCMEGDTDIWEGPDCATRDEAEKAMQDNFDAEIAKWTMPMEKPK